MPQGLPISLSNSISSKNLLTILGEDKNGVAAEVEAFIVVLSLISLLIFSMDSLAKGEARAHRTSSLSLRYLSTNPGDDVNGLYFTIAGVMD